MIIHWKWFFISLALIGCGRGCTTQREIERSEETRKIKNHRVEISAVKYEQTTTFLKGLFRKGDGKIRQRDSYYASFWVKIDDRPVLKDANYAYLNNEDEYDTDELLDFFDIHFSSDNTHFKTGYKKEYNLWHMLKSGTPFCLVYTHPDADLFSDMEMDNLPSASQMLDSLIINRYESYLAGTSFDQVVQTLSEQQTAGHFDFLLLTPGCESSLVPRVLNPLRIKKCLRNPSWKRKAIASCRDTLRMNEHFTKFRTLIIHAADEKSLDYYDKRYAFSVLQNDYIDDRLASGRNTESFRRKLVLAMRKALGDAAKNGFDEQTGLQYTVMKYMKELRDPALINDVYRAIIKTEDFDPMAMQLRDKELFGMFSGTQQREIIKMAEASFMRDVKWRWSTWSFLEAHLSCDELEAILRKFPEARSRYKLPSRCQTGHV